MFGQTSSGDTMRTGTGIVLAHLLARPTGRLSRRPGNLQSPCNSAGTAARALRWVEGELARRWHSAPVGDGEVAWRNRNAHDRWVAVDRYTCGCWSIIRRVRKGPKVEAGNTGAYGIHHTTLGDGARRVETNDRFTTSQAAIVINRASHGLTQGRTGLRFPIHAVAQCPLGPPVQQTIVGHAPE